MTRALSLVILAGVLPVSCSNDLPKTPPDIADDPRARSDCGTNSTCTASGPSLSFCCNSGHRGDGVGLGGARRADARIIAAPLGPELLGLARGRPARFGISARTIMPQAPALPARDWNQWGDLALPVAQVLSRLLRAKNKGFDPVKVKWTELHEVFESSQVDIDVDEFLHHFWLSSAGKYVAAKKMFVEIKKDISTQALAEQMLKDLVVNARLYRSIVEPGFAKWRKDECTIRRSLEALSVFRVRQPFPLVLSIIRAYRGKAISKKNTEAMLKAIERFHFAYTAVAAKSSSGGLSFMYAAWARQLYSAKTESSKQKVVKEIVKGLTARLPSKADFAIGFGSIRYSDELTKQKKLVQYILRKISDSCSCAGVATDHDQMTIEHIASQSPSDTIAKVSADSVAKLGNLLWCNTALQDQLKNKPFTQKREILKASAIDGRDEVVKASSWTDKEIDRRTRDLATLAYEDIWK